MGKNIKKTLAILKIKTIFVKKLIRVIFWLVGRKSPLIIISGLSFRIKKYKMYEKYLYFS
jgi:hypothetical protein